MTYETTNPTATPAPTVSAKDAPAVTGASTIPSIPKPYGHCQWLEEI
jgi:hypothetical protein